MTQKVRVVEYLQEMREAGLETGLADLTRYPMVSWKSAPAERRAAFLARQGLDPETDAVTGMRLLRPRWGGKEPTDLVLELSLSTERHDLAARVRAMRDRLAYVGVHAAPEEDAKALDELVLDMAFRRAGRPHPTRLLDVLDGVWGGASYAAETDGILCSGRPPPGHEEVERYAVHPPFAAVTVLRDPGGELLYHPLEPRLSPLENSLLSTLNDRLRDVISFEVSDDHDRTRYLAEKVFESLHSFRFRASRQTAYKLAYYFVRNYLGYGRLDVAMRDDHVEDISCNGADLPLYVVHARHQNMRTSMRFDETELDSMTVKLAQRGGKLLSIATPLVDATLPDGSRLQASIGREVTSRGSAFTVRKFREDPLTCVDLIRGGTHTLDSMAFLWLAVELRLNLLVMGATASGKTTTLNCLSQFIPPTSKIVSIEDTREITLQHENWLASVTREAFTGESRERISMFDLLRAALRQRPEYIIVGEIRGAEGLTLFQAMSTGHTCFSTMHAGNVENAVYRLENAPIGVPRVMLTSLDLFLVQGLTEIDNHPVRRMLAITEVGGLDATTRNLRTSELFRWDPGADAIQRIGKSASMDVARNRRGWSRADLDEQLEARRAVLEGLVERNERRHGQVAHAVQAFYGRFGGDVAAAPGDDLDAGFDVAGPVKGSA